MEIRFTALSVAETQVPPENVGAENDAQRTRVHAIAVFVKGDTPQESANILQEMEILTGKNGDKSFEALPPIRLSLFQV